MTPPDHKALAERLARHANNELGGFYDLVSKDLLREAAAALTTSPSPQADKARGEGMPSAADWCDENDADVTWDWKAGWDACRVEFPCSPAGEASDGRKALERAAEEIEQGHTWLTAVGASAIIRKHINRMLTTPQPQGDASPDSAPELDRLTDVVHEGAVADAWKDSREGRDIDYHKNIRAGLVLAAHRELIVAPQARPDGGDGLMERLNAIHQQVFGKPYPAHPAPAPDVARLVEAVTAAKNEQDQTRALSAATRGEMWLALEPFTAAQQEGCSHE